MTEEERRVYTDYLSDNKGNALFFYLGEYSDMKMSEHAKVDFDNKDNALFSYLRVYSDMKMSEYAKKDFERVGEIRLLISPNRGLTGYTIVSIGRRVESHYGVASIYIDPHYGPIIYHKGAHWYKPGSDPKKKKEYTDYQPYCEISGVKLENSADAQRDVQRLLSFLRKTGRLHWDEKTRQALKSNGKPLTEKEYKIAKRFGLIISKKEWFFFEQDCGVHPNYKYMK